MASNLFRAVSFYIVGASLCRFRSLFFACFFFCYETSFSFFLCQTKKTPHELTSFHPRLLRAHVRLSTPKAFRRVRCRMDAASMLCRNFVPILPSLRPERGKSPDNDNGRLAGENSGEFRRFSHPASRHRERKSSARA